MTGLACSLGCGLAHSQGFFATQVPAASASPRGGELQGEEPGHGFPFSGAQLVYDIGVISFPALPFFNRLPSL